MSKRQPPAAKLRQLVVERDNALKERQYLSDKLAGIQNTLGALADLLMPHLRDEMTTIAADTVEDNYL